MLTAKKFASSIAAIRKNDELFRQLVADTLAFSIFHARNHGQKTPFMELQAAAPGWLQKHLKSVPLGKVAAKHALSEENAEHEASFRVAEWFATHEEQKAIRAANRKAKAPATPKVEIVEPMSPETIDSGESEAIDSGESEAIDSGESEAIDGESKIVDVECGIIFGGAVTVITEAEAEALVAYLTQLRMPALKVA